MCIKDGFAEKNVVIMKDLDIRLVGQSYEITIPYDNEISKISESFDEAHEQAYGYCSSDSPREVVNIRVSALVRLPKFSLASLPPGGVKPPEESYIGIRKVYLKQQWVEVNVYRKSHLLSGNLISGPSIIEQADTTCFIDVGWLAEVLSDGHLILTKLNGE
jgi:N-methylhydantoinase A